MVISNFRNNCISKHKAAFSLIEMVAVIAILVTLMTAGVSLMNGSGQQSRKAASDLLTGMIEQARTHAITSRSCVLIAIAEPGDLPSGDERCRVGLFKVEDGKWTDASMPPAPVPCTQLNRWQALNTGVVLIGGDVDGVANPLDQDEITLKYGGSKNLSVKVYIIAFNSRGGLFFPSGSTPIALRIAEGAYRGGKATANKRGTSGEITENRLKIGRLTARPYRIDG